MVVSTSSRDVQLCLAILNLWMENRSYKIYSPLDVVAISVEASAAPTKNVFKPVNETKNFNFKSDVYTHFLVQLRNISTLAETAIYVATVEKYTDVLRDILNWVAENKEEVGDIKLENADCILHAALEDDKDQVD